MVIHLQLIYLPYLVEVVERISSAAVITRVRRVNTLRLSTIAPPSTP